MQRRNTAEAIVAHLVANGIDRLYCLPGVQNDPFFDALFHEKDRLRPIHTRHEQGAAYMALGAALATGKPQAMCVVPGPGFLNAATPLATAYSTNARIFSLVGQIAAPLIGRMTGALHEVVDQSGILRSMVKQHAVVRDASEVPAAMEAAFRALLSGRPRPVGMEVPMDVWTRTAMLSDPRPVMAPEAPPLDEDAIEAAAKLLGAAERPLILAGGGANDVPEALRALAEALDAPVVTYRMGHGALDWRHPMAANLAVGHRAWADADVVIGIGTRMQAPLGVWGTDAAMTIIRIDADVEEMNRFRAPHVGLLGDAARILPALVDRLAKHNRKRPGRAAKVAELKGTIAAEMAARIAPQLAWVDAIRSEMPEDGILLDELTQVGYVSRIAYPAYKPRTFLSSGYQGTLGYGFATGLGAKVACPDVPVVALAGDGGFMFTVQELATAVQFRIPLVTLVFNDNAFGNVRRFQQQNFGNRVIASDLQNPDFVKLAECFGAQGLRVRTPEELRPALRRAFATDGPTLIEIPTGEMPDPWKFIQMPKIRG